MVKLAVEILRTFCATLLAPPFALTGLSAQRPRGFYWRFDVDDRTGNPCQFVRHADG